VDEWERQKHFPAHEVFKILGQAGFLGITKPTSEYSSWGQTIIYMYIIVVCLIDVKGDYIITDSLSVYAVSVLRLCFSREAGFSYVGFLLIFLPSPSLMA